MLSKLLSFFGDSLNDQEPLNATIGGYINKIVSYWLIKETELTLKLIIRQKGIISSLFNHLYLTSCVTDLLVRICTVRMQSFSLPDDYRNLRHEIIQHCVNGLEQHHKNDFITEQIFEVLLGVVRKCYQMNEPKDFFDMLMSPFIIQPILNFTFAGGQQTSQGAHFLKTLFFNMFIAEPNDAIQDVMEINFGFQIQSIAGMSAEEFKKKNQLGSEGEATGGTGNTEM